MRLPLQGRKSGNYALRMKECQKEKCSIGKIHIEAGASVEEALKLIQDRISTVEPTAIASVDIDAPVESQCVRPSSRCSGCNVIGHKINQRPNRRIICSII